MNMADLSLLQRLDGIEARFEEVSTLITDPAVIADMKRYVRLSKEYKDLEKLTASTRRYRSLVNDVEEAKALLASENDADMREMAKEQLDAATEALPALEEEIKLLLIPADPEDSKNAILEIRGGTGGDEAAIFAGDLCKMYIKYCESRGWNVAITSASEGAAGGYKEVVLSVTGDGVYGILKYESGVHRVQRVPATETQGRVHTSAATVAVLPEAEPFDVEINEGEIKWDTFRSGGAGGRIAGFAASVHLAHDRGCPGSARICDREGAAPGRGSRRRLHRHRGRRELGGDGRGNHARAAARAAAEAPGRRHGRFRAR